MMLEKKRSSGFTLIEVMVSLMILSAGMLIAIRLQTGTLSLAKKSHDHGAVVLLARQKMDEALSGALKKSETRGQEQDGTKWSVSVSPLDETPDEGPCSLMRITVVVEGPDHGPRYSLMTVKALLS